MSAERGSKKVDGELPGPAGPLQSFVGTITASDVTVYDPPLRGLRVGAAGAGNVVLVYAGDDEAVAGNRETVAVSNGQLITGFLIRQVRATGTTASGLTGYR